MLCEELKHSLPAARVDEVEYGLVRKSDLEAAARIYVRSFPRRAGKLFRKEEHAVWFYRDLMELMQLAHGGTFFAARSGGRLIGYLILILPDKSLFRAMWRQGFFLRAMGHCLAGRYGSPLFMVGLARKALLAGPNSGKANGLSDSPHVYVVAVDQNHTGRGVGSALLGHARRACQPQFRRMWLYVDVENGGATRLYERFGFRTVRSVHSQHEMVWDF